jgi:hypothetical protein
MLSELLEPYGLTNGVRGLDLKSDGLACASRNALEKVRAMDIRTVWEQQADKVGGALQFKITSPIKQNRLTSECFDENLHFPRCLCLLVLGLLRIEQRGGV